MITDQAALSTYMITPVWSDDWAWGLPLIVLTVVIHVLGLGFIYQKALELFRSKMEHRHSTALFAVIMSTMILLATTLHGVEAGAWAVCYQFLGARPDFRSAMLYSLGAMTTFGNAGVSLEDHWRLMGAIEALSGWLLFGLTTAFLFGLVQKCYRIEGRDTRLQSAEKRN